MKNVLYSACEDGDLEIVKCIVNKYGVNIVNEPKYVCNGRLSYPIHAACRYGNMEIVKFLVEDCGANINVYEGQERKTPIQVAYENGYMEIVDYLIEINSNNEVIAS
ncbi:MAG: ankyrin repeat domain-containing protein [Candidatus Anstonellales archaeon]